MKHQTRILLVDDHRILREGLRAILEAEADFVVVGEASDGREAIRRAQELQPDVVVTDQSMPRMNGIDSLKELKRVAPAARLLLLTVHEADEYVFSALREGADGYMLKDSSARELVTGVRCVLAGNRYLSPPITGQVLQAFIEGRSLDEQVAEGNLISAREREILKLVAEGYRSRQIAQQLSISEKTVEKHRANLMRKLRVNSVSGLTAYAITHGVVSR